MARRCMARRGSVFGASAVCGSVSFAAVGIGWASEGERCRSTEEIRSATSVLITPPSSDNGRTIRYRSGV